MAFDGSYTVHNPHDQVATATVLFEFRTSSAIYDDFEFRVEQVEVTPTGDTGRGLTAVVQVTAKVDWAEVFSKKEPPASRIGEDSV